MSSTSNPNNAPGPEPKRPHKPATAPHPGTYGVTPLATYSEVDRLTALLHEINNLLDGSMRCLGMAKKSLSSDTVIEAATATQAERHLHTAAEGLERMAELVHAAMQGRSTPIGSPLLARARPVTLGEAVQHAADVLRPLASERTVELAINMAPSVASLPAGALYTVILNGVQNAVESVSRRGGRGHVEISIRHDAPPVSGSYGRDTRDWLLLEVTDDGVGPPASSDAARVFDLGFTTKPRGTGVGLAVARSVVQGMGGTIELLPPANPSRAAARKAGAVLRVKFPAPIQVPGLKLGGAA